MSKIKVTLLIFLMALSVIYLAQNIQTVSFVKSEAQTLIENETPSNLFGGRSQALWVFPGGVNPDPVTDFRARNHLIFNSWRSGVDKLYVSVYQPTPNSRGRRMYEDRDLAQLITLAHFKRRQEVWAAYGAPDWAQIGCAPTAFPLQRMAEVAAYNNSHRTTDKFDGVILDVEPDEPQTETEFRALLDLYSCVRQSLPPNIKLAVAIRFFWDLPVDYPTGGAVKPVYQHIIDLNLDNVVVMGYRDYAGTGNCAGGDGIICLDKDEIAYAASINKPKLVLVGLETLPDLANRVSFFEEGQNAMHIEAQTVSNFFAGSFGGFAIHNYQNAYLSGSTNWNTPAQPLP